MDERVRFYVESHIAGAVVRKLREMGADVVTAFEAGLLDAADPEHLEFARQQGRVLVSRDADFPGLHRLGFPHAGIIYFAHSPGIGYIIEHLSLVLNAATADEMIGQLLYF